MRGITNQPLPGRTSGRGRLRSRSVAGILRRDNGPLSLPPAATFAPLARLPPADSAMKRSGRTLASLPRSRLGHPHLRGCATTSPGGAPVGPQGEKGGPTGSLTGSQRPPPPSGTQPHQASYHLVRQYSQPRLTSHSHAVRSPDRQTGPQGVGPRFRRPRRHRRHHHRQLLAPITGTLAPLSWRRLRGRRRGAAVRVCRPGRSRSRGGRRPDVRYEEPGRASGDRLAVLSPWWPGPIAVNRARASSSWAAIMSLTSAFSGVSAGQA